MLHRTVIALILLHFVSTLPTSEKIQCGNFCTMRESVMLTRWFQQTRNWKHFSESRLVSRFHYLNILNTWRILCNGVISLRMERWKITFFHLLGWSSISSIYLFDGLDLRCGFGHLLCFNDKKWKRQISRTADWNLWWFNCWNKLKNTAIKVGHILIARNAKGVLYWGRLNQCKSTTFLQKRLLRNRLLPLESKQHLK